MRKFFITIAFSIYAFANSFIYKTVIQKYDEYGERGQVVKFYDGDKLVLSFVLNETGGDCLNKEYQKGVYLFKNNKLYLYTKWYSKSNLGYKKTVYLLKDDTPKKILSIFWIKNPKEDIKRLQEIYHSNYITDKDQQKNLQKEFEQAEKEFSQNLWKR